MRLGQHFLINKDKIKKIVGALNLKNGDTVIEIGPGHGEMTEAIIERLKDLKIEKFKIVAIEKDKKLVKKLRNLIEIKKLRNFVEIIEGDALKILPKIIFQFSNLSISNYKLVGNIPYYITGYLLRILGELKKKPSVIVLTIQKEVAERVVARPPKMNLLAASVQFWAEPKIVDYVSRKDFRPRPKVDSAIIRLSPTRNYAEWNAELRGKYYKFVKILFRQPRKTILNNLVSSIRHQASGIEKEKVIKKLEELNINPQDRPQDLSLEQITKLSQIS